jgi:nitrous-oxide reductase
LCIPGGDTKSPNAKYLIVYNKITKDRYLPTGPELAQSAQIFDITGEKMQLILDLPTIGEPHYAQAVAADVIRNNSVKFYKLEENTNAFVSKGEAETKVVRKGNRVDVYITAIRSHFSPDNIEGIKWATKSLACYQPGTGLMPHGLPSRVHWRAPVMLEKPND